MTYELPPNNSLLLKSQCFVTTLGHSSQPLASTSVRCQSSTSEYMWTLTYLNRLQQASQMSESNCCTHEWWNYCVLLVFESLLYSCTSSLMNTWMRVYKGKITLRGPWSLIAKVISLVIRWYSHGNITRRYTLFESAAVRPSWQRITGEAFLFPWFLL